LPRQWRKGRERRGREGGTRPGVPWGFGIGGSFPALGAAGACDPCRSPVPDVRRRLPYPCRGNLGVLGGFQGCNPTGGGGSELAERGNPSGFTPMHFFCNKPCYCSVLGKLIG